MVRPLPAGIAPRRLRVRGARAQDDGAGADPPADRGDRHRGGLPAPVPGGDILPRGAGARPRSMTRAPTGHGPALAAFCRRFVRTLVCMPGTLSCSLICSLILGALPLGSAR